MKLKRGFITHNKDGEQILVAVGGAVKKFNGLVRTNQTAATIIECLKEPTDEQSIVKVLCERFDADEKRVSTDVHKVIEQLRKIGAIDE